MSVKERACACACKCECEGRCVCVCGCVRTINHSTNVCVFVKKCERMRYASSGSMDEGRINQEQV